MMKPANIQIDIKQGATLLLGLVYKDRFRKPYDLSGCTAHMQIRTPCGELVQDLSTSNGGIKLNTVPGAIDMFISAADTAAMDFKLAEYDLFLIDSLGMRRCIFAGKVLFQKAATK